MKRKNNTCSFDNIHSSIRFLSNGTNVSGSNLRYVLPRNGNFKKKIVFIIFLIKSFLFKRKKIKLLRLELLRFRYQFQDEFQIYRLHNSLALKFKMFLSPFIIY